MRETKPVQFKQANDVLLGGDTGAADLPIFRGEQHVVSCWRLPWIRRVRVLLTGCVYLVVQGKTHPPVYVETDEFRRADR